MLSLITGQSASGKTCRLVWDLKMIYEKYEIPILVIDPNDEYGFFGFNSLSIDLIHFNKGLSRIVTNDPKNVISIRQKIRNQILVIDSFDSFISSNNIELYTSMCAHKTHGLNVFLVFSSLKNAGPRLIQNAEYIRIHKDRIKCPNWFIFENIYELCMGFINSSGDNCNSLLLNNRTGKVDVVNLFENSFLDKIDLYKRL